MASSLCYVPSHFCLRSRYFPSLISACGVWEWSLPVMIYYNNVHYYCCDVLIYDQLKMDQEISNNMLGKYGTLRMRTAISRLKEPFTPEANTWYACITVCMAPMNARVKVAFKSREANAKGKISSKRLYLRLYFQRTFKNEILTFAPRCSIDGRMNQLFVQRYRRLLRQEMRYPSVQI